MDVLDPTTATAPGQKQDDLLAKFKEVASQLVIRKILENISVGVPVVNRIKPEGKTVILRIRAIIFKLVEVIKTIFAQLGWFRKSSTAE